MKLIHLSDLHIGKRVNEYSMLEDQEYILTKIINIIDDEKPDGVIIAGDVYDKSVPSAEAVSLFDDFLVRLSKRELSVFIISGNHDSPERIAFGGRLMERSGIYLSPVYNGSISPITLEDGYGRVNIWMLPFVKPVHVRKYNEEAEINSYTDAVNTVISGLDINTAERNIMITHQFVTGAERSESEELSVGGSDNVSASVFEPFDYTALGHLHRPQNCGDRIRYSGTPLKYSFSEAKDNKSVTVVELYEKGRVEVRTVDLIPMRDMVELKGRYDELVLRDFYIDTTYQEDYTHITLTDEDDIPDAIGKLRVVYHNLMKLDYDNKRTKSINTVEGATGVEEKTPFDHFSELYELQNNQPMTDEQSHFLGELIEKIWEGER
ncbi:MAG: exonuclease SbcCD subunit D [Clostridia bacterium]|nr:exonuclease SbcCD subunit D [Clostridia bacterium]